MMLLLSVVIIVVTLIFKCSCKRNQEEPVLSMVDAMEMTMKSDAGSARGLPELPPESPVDVTEVSPHSLISPRSPTAGHIAALSSASSISPMAPPAPPADAMSMNMMKAHSPNSPSRAEGLDYGAAVRGNTAGMQIEEDVLPQHPSAMESGISMSLNQDDGQRDDGRRDDSHLVFQNTLKNLFEADGAA